jgi:hypothetical protein
MMNLEQDDQEQLFIPPLNFAMVAPGVYVHSQNIKCKDLLPPPCRRNSIQF